jgi:regulator of sirC expression with transglutaminase-like and TPR domain
MRELDLLAADAQTSDADSLAHFLFEERGFAGNTVDYGDPRNSLLDDVLDRRLGIPITLSVLMIEVGRRRGIALHGVGMPGHFLVGSGRPSVTNPGRQRVTRAERSEDSSYYDAFARGARLDTAACIERFAETHPREAFRSAFLAPVGARTIVDRMLANLQHTFLAREPAAAAWPVRLRLCIPDRPAAARVELAGVLGRIGRFAEAAAVIDAAAGELPDGRGDQLRRTAARFRARSN